MEQIVSKMLEIYQNVLEKSSQEDVFQYTYRFLFHVSGCKQASI